MESNLKPESMDIAYVRYEPIEEPYSSLHASRGGHYRPNIAYSGGTHYVETVNYNDYEGRSVVYEEVPNNPQQGHWRSGNYKPGSKRYNNVEYYEQSYYSPVTKSFQTKSFGKSNTGVTAEGPSSYSSARPKTYNAASSTPTSYGYEEVSGPKIATKPLQVKIVNPRPATAVKMKNSAQTFQQKVHVPPASTQTVVNNSLGGAKKKSLLQYSYQTSFVGAGASRKFQDSNEGGIEENGGGGSRTAKWKGPGTVDGGVRKKKKSMRKFNIKKYVQPKNALMCLNELVQGQTLKFDQEGTSTLGAPICMTVEVNGQKYKGFGSSKLSAKQAAAEAALVSFVKPPPPSEEEDKTPWGVLASFAMFKLFNEWKEGRIGMNSSSTPAASFGAPMTPDPTFAQTIQTMLKHHAGEIDSNKVAAAQAKVVQSNLVSNNLANNNKQDDASKIIPLPAKAVPENAASINPVMLLHQMRPSLTYEQFCSLKGDHQEFCLKCTIDGQTFEGVGGTVKKAKYDLAVKANRQLFNVISTYTPPPNPKNA